MSEQLICTGYVAELAANVNVAEEVWSVHIQVAVEPLWPVSSAHAVTCLTVTQRHHIEPSCSSPTWR